MKKLLLALLVMGSLAYADDSDCSQAAAKVASKLAAHNMTKVKLTYSADNAQKATACQTALAAKNITVDMNQVSGSGKFKFGKD